MKGRREDGSKERVRILLKGVEKQRVSCPKILKRLFLFFDCTEVKQLKTVKSAGKYIFCLKGGGEKDLNSLMQSKQTKVNCLGSFKEVEKKYPQFRKITI